MSQPAIDLTSELLRGMRLSGVNYRRIETARPFGVGFSAVAGKAQFHFISRGPVLLRMASGEQFTLESGDALFIPNGDGHALLSDPQATVVNVAQLPSETVCSTVSCINAGDQPDCPERAVIFSGCMDFELGGMQPLVKAMPEVMRVSSLLNTWPEIQPLLVAMERESLTRQAGYAGLLVSLDEMVNLLKLNNTQARTANYEQILRILNDCLQGSAENIGFILGGTPEFLFDPRKGLYSYEALQSRLAENRFAQKAGVIDYSSPTLHLASLTPEELYILLRNLRHVYAGGDPENYLVPDEALTGFLHHCSKTIGDAYFRTPRNTIKGFLDMLVVLEQNRTMNWQTLIEGVAIEEDRPSEMDDAIIEESDDDDGLANFKL